MENRLKDIQKAINHYEYGIKCDIFQGEVKVHAQTAVDALKFTKEHLKSQVTNYG